MPALPQPGEGMAPWNSPRGKSNSHLLSDSLSPLEKLKGKAGGTELPGLCQARVLLPKLTIPVTMLMNS